MPRLLKYMSRTTRRAKTSGTVQDQATARRFSDGRRVVCPVSTPISGLGGAAGFRASLAPVGAIVTVARMTPVEFRTSEFRTVEFKTVEFETVSYKSAARRCNRASACVAEIGVPEIGVAGAGVHHAVAPRHISPISKVEPVTRLRAWMVSTDPDTSGARRTEAAEVVRATTGTRDLAAGKAEVISYADI